MRILLVAFALAPLLQDPTEEAVTLAREIRKHHDTASDSELRLRLAEIVRKMSDRASLSLCGEPEDPDHPVVRLYDLRNIISRLKDSYSPDFWRWSRPDGSSEFTLDEPREAPIGEEEIVELVREYTGADRWVGEVTLDKTPNGQLLVHAPPDLQRKVARVIQVLHREALAGVRISVTLFASSKPLATGAGVDGAMAEASWERLCKDADEGAIKRLGSIETVAQLDQTVCGFSGVRRPVAMSIGDNGPVAGTIPDGLALEAHALRSGERVSLRLRLAYTKVMAVDDVATPKGTLRLPRLAEAGFADLRAVPVGAAVVLGTMGPFAAESEIPPHVIVVARLSWVRP